MNKFVFFLGICWFTTSGAIGQTSGSAAKSHFDRPNIDTLAMRTAESIRQPLRLSAAQVTRMYLIERVYLTGRFSMPNNLSTAERKREVDRLEKTRMDEIKKALTAQQYQSYLLLLEQRKRKMEERRRTN